MGHDNSLKEKVRNDSLQNYIWQNARDGTCPFETNRGYASNDWHCHDCARKKQCQHHTQRRQLGILYGLSELFTHENQEFYDNYYTKPYEENEYFSVVLNETADQETVNRCINAKHQEIKERATFIIQKYIHPDKLNTNTRLYFNNCFPEWRLYEQWTEDNELETSMARFHAREIEKTRLRLGESYIDEDNWRCYRSDEKIPKKAHKEFIRDYFTWLRDKLEKRKRAGKRLFTDTKTNEDELSEERKWMSDDKVLNKWLQSRNGKFFLLLVRYFKIYRMLEKKSLSIAKKFNCNKKWVFIQPDRQDVADWLCKQETLRGINISTGKVYRFLKWMSDNHLIEKVGKPGSNEQLIYAIGTWRPHFRDPVTGELRSGGMDTFIIKANKKRLKDAITKKI